MKKETSAILLIITYILLYTGGISQNIMIASAGIILMLLNAILTITQSEDRRTSIKK